jgi:hypothetical protein
MAKRPWKRSVNFDVIEERRPILAQAFAIQGVSLDRLRARRAFCVEQQKERQEQGHIVRNGRERFVRDKLAGWRVAGGCRVILQPFLIESESNALQQLSQARVAGLRHTGKFAAEHRAGICDGLELTDLSAGSAGIPLRDRAAPMDDLLMNCVAPFNPELRSRNPQQVDAACQTDAVREGQFRTGAGQIIRNDETHRTIRYVTCKVSRSGEQHGCGAGMGCRDERFAGLRNEVEQTHLKRNRLGLHSGQAARKTLKSLPVAINIHFVGDFGCR